MENDLISQSALIERLKIAKSNMKFVINGIKAVDIGAVIEFVGNAPAVDAVKVVRCRDCKHWDKEPDEREGCCFGIADGTMLTEPDEFCSRGERRADDGTP
jgi:hypothetical protein